MPKQTIFLETPVFLFSLLRIFDGIFDVMIDDPYLVERLLKTHTQIKILASLKKLKPNYFKKQHSSSSFLLTQDNNTGPKWQWSTKQGSFMS